MPIRSTVRAVLWIVSVWLGLASVMTLGTQLPSQFLAILDSDVTFRWLVANLVVDTPAAVALIASLYLAHMLLKSRDNLSKV